MSTEEKFYEVTTENGTFWLRAENAAAAWMLMQRILQSDPMATSLKPAYDVAFVETEIPT